MGASILGLCAYAPEIPWAYARQKSEAITPGDTQQHATLCVDAKSAALVGQTVDDQPDVLVEILQDMIRSHKCVFLPGALVAIVTMKQKMQHVAATDVWEVEWDGEKWFVPVDAPRYPDL